MIDELGERLGDGLVNVAARKPARQSSDYSPDALAGCAVEPQPARPWIHPRFHASHTGNDNPSWCVRPQRTRT